MQPSRAICRSVSTSFHRALTQCPTAPIDVAKAELQHADYVQALQSLGLDVTVLPADPVLPDCCFVEDCAVVAEEIALITHSAAPTRRGEQLAVAEALQPLFHLEMMTAPATLDGGDCLRLGKRMFVGRSQRTNAAGIMRLREVFEPLGLDVIEIPLGPIFHLKCVCSRLDDDTLLLADGTLPASAFGPVRIVCIPADEAYAANCVCIGRTALLSAGFPAARRAVEAEGFRTIELDMSEIRKADGSLTCLSILV